MPTEGPGDRVHSFPLPRTEEGRRSLEARLVQGADLSGQLGDPLYLKKANALYYEFEEIGLNRQLGYASRPISSSASRISSGAAFRHISKR